MSNPAKKVLIVYATAGIGHKKAAMAIKKAFDEKAYPGVEVTLIDALDYTTDFFKWSYLQLYLTLVNKLPLVWGFFYYLTDIPFINWFVAPLRRINNWAYSKKMVAYLGETKPDVVISTHFFASEVIADLRARGKTAAKLVTVVTDYRLHSWWVADGTSEYVVSNDDACADLIRWHVDPAHIHVIGIPVEPVFSRALVKSDVAQKLGIRTDLFTILVIGGGFGVGPIEDIVKAAAQVPTPVQLVAVCGHNEELVKRINALRATLSIHLVVLGFIDNVYEYMEVADVLISKAGGITVSETLAKRLPMIIIAPIMGQETRNSDFLMRHGAAIIIKKPAELVGVVTDLMQHREKVRAMQTAMDVIRRPASCFDIAALALKGN